MPCCAWTRWRRCTTSCSCSCTTSRPRCCSARSCCWRLSCRVYGGKWQVGMLYWYFVATWSFGAAFTCTCCGSICSRDPWKSIMTVLLRCHIPEHQDEVVYYDAFESPDAMKGEEDPPTPPSPLREEDLSILQLRTRQLEARRGRITAKKVYLKNKKVPACFIAACFSWALYLCAFYLKQEICIINHDQKVQQRQGSHDDSSSLETTLQVRRWLCVTLSCLTPCSQSAP